ncbi:WD40 repeat-like protein [Byssothecium circinans]|uniref:WD40 repeat-like protein n=1 Tax=Byssothecium circinans TaxID=147558 RepID=A0A6A5T9A4_9PLEO|nr:WD40 repeat-like protein [Byssothecium circinans]
MHTHSELPSLRSTIRLQGTPELEQIQWYDVKFYPYTSPGGDAVFAVVGSRLVVVCRCVNKADSTIEVLRQFEDESPAANGSFNSVEWSQAENGDPLVCVTGSSSQIKILNVRTGEVATTLIGHGAEVNDLAISPVDPTILASASIDHAIRLWSLDPAHAKQPTAAILYGQGHKEQVLALAYHRKGRYLLSGGMDTKINLWMTPDDLKSHAGTDKPAMIHYPHFTTTEIHKDYVDCIRWYNDLILSSAVGEDTIQLWKIDNFHSDKPPPNPAPIPIITTVNSDTKVTVSAAEMRLKSTRSAWGGRFQRLLQFDLPGHSSFYMRFGLFHELGAHPLLVAGNVKSKIFLWDLQRLETLGTGELYTTTSKEGIKKGNLNLPHHIREGSTTSVGSGTSGAQSVTSASVHTANTKGSGRGGRTSKKVIDRGIGDPFYSIKPHKELTLQKYTTTFRQFAWSKDGQWCVGAGEFSIISILHRWEHGGPPPPERNSGR